MKCHDLAKREIARVLSAKPSWSFGRVGTVLCLGFEIQGYLAYVVSDAKLNANCSTI
jgi:hypothetical protein